MDDTKATESILEGRINALNDDIRMVVESMERERSRLNELIFRRDSMTAELRRRRGE